MFFNVAKMKSLAAEGPKHRKEKMFLNTPQAKYTVNYRDFSRGECPRGSSGVGRRHGAQRL